MRRFVVPQGLNLEEIVEEIALNGGGKNKDKIRIGLKFLLSSIIYGSALSARSNEKSFCSERKGAYLMSSVLKKVLGQYVQVYIKVLVKHNVIKVGDSYVVNGHSKEYCLTEVYNKCSLIEEVNEDSDFTKVVYSAFSEKLNTNPKGGSVLMPSKEHRPKSHKLLSQVLKENKLKINEEGARAWINSHCNELLASGNYGSHTFANPEHKRYAYNVMVDAFLDHEYNPKNKFDEFGRRFHSLLTYCPSGLRQFLSWDGEALVALDLKNSQPYLLNVMFNKSFVGGAGSFSLRALMPELHDHLAKMGAKKKEELNLEAYLPDIRTQVINSAIKKQISPLFIMLHNTSQSQYYQGVEKVNFQSLVKEGTLYDFIQMKFQGKYKERPPLSTFRFTDRNSTKKEVLFMLYHNPRDKRKSARIRKPYKEFCNLFPAQGNVLNLLKSKDFKDAPRLLQRVESYLFLEKIAKPLIQKGIPVLTIHDSIIVPEKHKGQALSLMEDVLQNHVNQTPTIKVEVWDLAKPL